MKTMVLKVTKATMNESALAGACLDMARLLSSCHFPTRYGKGPYGNTLIVEIPDDWEERQGLVKMGPLCAISTACVFMGTDCEEIGVDLLMGSPFRYQTIGPAVLPQML